MKVELHNIDNMLYETEQKFDIIFADYIYEDLNFIWIDKFWNYLNQDSIFICMTDFHSVAQCWMKLLSMPNSNFISHYIWVNEWGNYDKRKPHQTFDDILVFSNGENYKYYPDRVQVNKVAINKGLNPSGRMTKPATSVISDICLTTTSLERVKMNSGKLLRWQKPLKLYERCLNCYDDEGDWVLDLFMGSGSLAESSILNNRNYVGIEYDKEVFDLAKKRLEKYELT